MTQHTIFREQMLETFENLKQDFAQALKDAKQQEQNFDTALNQFQKNTLAHIANSSSQLSSENPLSPALQQINATLQSTIGKWNEKIQQQDKGVGFRSGFNDSLLVFVYGKVKSGKSSLGNYVAWGNTDPTPELQKSIDVRFHPEYFSGERAEFKYGDAEREAEKNKSFRVGATEATSSIQGFSLSGLTWVDSPGLHSVNAQNGDLAKQYVEHSDLILYTMKSDSPGRESDIREILELYRADKKILLLITGSDDTDEDVNSKGELVQVIVMKDKERRQRQINHVRETLEKLPELQGKTDNIDIISFSARYAQMNADNAVNFHDSGMGQLFEKLHQVASEEGVKLKQKVPMLNFKHYINGFAQDVSDIETALEELHQPIQRIQREVPRLVGDEIRHIQSTMYDILHERFDAIIANREDSASQVEAALNQLQATLQEKHNQLFDESQTKIITQILSEMEQGLTDSIKNNATLSIPKFQIETVRVAEGKYVAGNRGSSAAIGAATGAAIGSAIPVVGTAIGGFVGGFVGGLLGRSSRRETRYVYERSGDNLMSIRQAISSQLQDITREHMGEFQQVLIERTLKTATDLQLSIEQEIGLFKSAVNNIQNEIEAKL
ncbi:dynamin family protein [Moraxella nasicaprae]|uniref:dynamin family protein n=1 Tax=Moraxella nasicaprae TaxID=2904122 RepID=UPI0021D999F2|nr:dynamin family protein [Moraxella nasicaprae]